MQRTDELTISEPEGFSVHDEESANWVIRRIAEARKYAERVEAWAALELRRAEREEKFFLERYGPQLEGERYVNCTVGGSDRVFFHASGSQV